MDASGAVLDRWAGFRGAAEWLRVFREATANLQTIEAKEEAFKTSPTESLASALGRIYASMNDGKGAVEFYREAERLAGNPNPAYRAAIFFAQARGLATGSFTAEDVRAAGEALLATIGAEPLDVLLVANTMADIAADKKEPGLFAPFLRPALAATEGLRDERSARLRSDLQVAGALLVEGDEGRAVSLKKASMPAGWEENADELNRFAWWCFEYKVDLEEAEQLARKSADLAMAGPERAQALDTAAEIANLRGNPGEAISLSERASKEDPKEEHYSRQVKRFTELRDTAKPASGA